MRKTVSAVDLEWLSNRADILLLAHLTQVFPIPTTIFATGITNQTAAALQQRYPKAYFSSTDLKLTTLPAANHSIDLFIANLLAEHELDLINLFSEVERVLSDDGLLLFTTNDSRTKSMLSKYAQEVTDDLVDENTTTEKLEKIDVMRFFFRRYHILMIEPTRQFIDCDVFIASAAFPPQLLKKFLEYPIRIDEIVLSTPSVLTEKESQLEEKKEVDQEGTEIDEADEKEDRDVLEEAVDVHESKVEASEKLETTELPDRDTVSESTEMNEVEPVEDRLESETAEEKEHPEAAEAPEQEGEEHSETNDTELETDNVTESEKIESSELHEQESNEPAEQEIDEPEEFEDSDEAEDEDVEEEEEPEELEESEEKKIEPEDEPHEPAESKHPEGSEYRELHTLTGLLHTNEKALQAHETLMTKELHHTIRVLSQSKFMHANAETKQKQTKQIEQHKQLLENYRSLTNKHKELVGNFLDNHARFLEKHADSINSFKQLIDHQHDVLERHDANIEQHETFLNTKD